MNRVKRRRAEDDRNEMRCYLQEDREKATGRGTSKSGQKDVCILTDRKKRREKAQRRVNAGCAVTGVGNV